MLELICYLVALILAGLAALAPSSPPFDRVRLLAGAFTAFVLPFIVHAGQGL